MSIVNTHDYFLIVKLMTMLIDLFPESESLLLSEPVWARARWPGNSM